MAPGKRLLGFRAPPCDESSIYVGRCWWQASGLSCSIKSPKFKESYRFYLYISFHRFWMKSRSLLAFRPMDFKGREAFAHGVACAAGQVQAHCLESGNWGVYIHNCSCQVHGLIMDCIPNAILATGLEAYCLHTEMRERQRGYNIIFEFYMVAEQ